MNITAEQIEKVIVELSGRYDETSNIIKELAKKELSRRRNAGRKATNKLTRKEQNRIAQRKYREKKKLG
jgi:predicted transcriptional regulator